MKKQQLKQIIKEEIANSVPSGGKLVIYQVYDTNDNEVLFKGSKEQILDWMWENFSKGLMGIEINQIN
jgi:hypothetical protein